MLGWRRGFWWRIPDGNCHPNCELPLQLRTENCHCNCELPLTTRVARSREAELTRSRFQVAGEGVQHSSDLDGLAAKLCEL